MTDEHRDGLADHSAAESWLASSGADTDSDHIELEGSAQEEKPGSPVRRFFAWCWHKKWFTIPALLLIGVVGAYFVPSARYGIGSLVVTRSVTVVLTDKQTDKPVSKATVTIDGIKGETDQTGKVILQGVKPGYHTATITKKHYKQSQQPVEVELFHNLIYKQGLVATGRQVTVKVVNAINQAPVIGGTVSLDKETTALTDKNGEASLVIASTGDKREATITGKDFHEAKLTIDPLGGADKNTARLTPSGTVYFLSKASGTIDVVKSNLDGSGRTVVLAGKGTEADNGTALLASRDWKYAALSAKRQSSAQPAGLYLIITENDTVIPIEESGLNVTPIGWSGHYFLYATQDPNTSPWQEKRTVLKSYDAVNKKPITLDENKAFGDRPEMNGYETLGSYNIIENAVVYTKIWQTTGLVESPEITHNLESRESAIMRAEPDGNNTKAAKTFKAVDISSLYGVAYAPQEVYFRGWTRNAGDSNLYLEYENGQVRDAEEAKVIEAENTPSPTYLISPKGDKSFWSDERDGKFALITGNKQGTDGKEIATGSEYAAYGWFSEEYLLVSKGGSELFVMPASGPIEGLPLLKISDYHKASSSFQGYGYGYGGL